MEGTRSKKRKRTAEETDEEEHQGEGATTTSQEDIQSDALVIATSQEVVNTLEQADGGFFLDRQGRWNDLASLRTYLNELRDEDARYAIFREQAERVADASEMAERWSESLDTMRDAMNVQARAEDKDLFNAMAARAKSYRTTRGRIETNKANIKRIWGNDAQLFIEQGPASGTYWRKLQTLSTEAIKADLTFNQVLRLINLSVLKRMTNRSKGMSNLMTVQTGDLQSAIENVNEVPNVQEYQRRLIAAGYGYGHNGLICASEHAVQFISDGDDQEETNEDRDESAIGAFPSPGLGNGQATITGTGNETGDSEELDDIDDVADQADHAYVQGGEEFLDGKVAQEDETEEEDSEPDDGTYEDKDGAEPTRKKRKTSDTAEEEIDEAQAMKKCLCIKAAKTFTSRFVKGFRTRQLDHSLVIKTWFRLREGICYRHECLILSSMGMTCKGYKAAEIKEHLVKFHEATINSTVGDMTTDANTYRWFRRSHRPVRPDDALGPYKFHHTADAAYRLTIEQQEDLCRYAGIDREEWDKIGSINVDCFGWWKEIRHEGISILDVALQEFEMYDHHLRYIDGKKNYGWLRTMFHGLAQQAMRQDPLYWMMYASLRKDRNADLVSYPYYAKYQHEGDWTFFRHIDINIPDLAKAGRGANQIQGTVSLDEEKEDDCTEIVPGMHHKMEDWAQRLAKREGVKISGLVNAITPKVFNDEDKARYETDWIAVPCRQLQVRISQPHIPHGAKGPAKRVRRTMLPWFVTVQSDGEHLEVLESGTWDDLAKAHRELTSAPRTPSGLANRYGDIPYAFPAAVPLAGLGPLSDSLVARYRPNNPAVKHEKKKLIEGDDDFRTQFIDQWRKKATRAAVEGFQLVRELEKNHFGDKSFFKRKERNDMQVLPADELPEGEYKFLPHGVRDEAAEQLAEEAAREERGSSEEGV